MDAVLRAAADKLIFDLANAKAVASTLPKGALERRVEATGRTLRETFAEMAARQAAQAASVASYFAGTPLASDDFRDDAAYERERARLGRKPALKAVFASLQESRDRLIASLGQSGRGAAVTAESGPQLLCIAHHIEPHALDFAEAVPEIRLEPLLLNWALEADFGSDEVLAKRQFAIFDAVRAELQAANANDADDDSDEE